MGKKLIVIDAGHGGKDTGAVGVTGKYEKTFNLDVALKLRDLLNNNSNFDVHLTRDTDVFIELSERANIANRLKADGFVSIHANSGPVTAVGTETWYTRWASKKLANVIHKHLMQATGLKDRGVQSKSLAVCRETKMPAVLTESGFVSNAAEEAKLFSEDFQNAVAQQIYEGLCEYFGIPATAPVTPPVVTPDKSDKYPKVDILVHTQPEQKVIGYSINNKTWIPSRPTAELVGGSIGYEKGKVTINGTPVETQLIDNVGYVWSRDFAEKTGARIFWDKANPNQVDIYPGGAV